MKDFTTDDIRDIAVKIVDKLVEQDLVINCMDTDDETEFEVQDIIVKQLNKDLDVDDMEERITFLQSHIEYDNIMLDMVEKYDEHDF